MKTPTKLLLGAATLYPLGYMIAFMGGMFLFVFTSMATGHPPVATGEHANGPPTWFIGLFAMHLLTMVSVAALMIFYSRDVFRNPRLDEQKRVLWAIVLFWATPSRCPSTGTCTSGASRRPDPSTAEAA